MKEWWVYVDVGDKTNYAACLQNEDGSLTFCGWMIKYCAKESSIIIKKDKGEIGL